MEFDMRVKNFVYNGFCGQDRPGFAPYQAAFITWTNDPGIIRVACSDGKERLVPSFALPDLDREAHPYVKIPEDRKMIFGYPSSSE